MYQLKTQQRVADSEDRKRRSSATQWPDGEDNLLCHQEDTFSLAINEHAADV